MAQSRASPLLLSTLLLLLAISTPPAAHATFLITNNAQGLIVTGALCCNQNGNCPGNPAVGATVSLNCKNLIGFSTVVGQNTTDVNGNFTITVPVAAIGSLPLSLSILPCVATVQLPLSAAVCPALSTATGVLDGLLQDVGTVTSQTLGLLRALRVSVFILLTFGA